MAQYPAVIALTGLDGSNGFRVLGTAASDAFGLAVSSAGDLNHDGLPDLLIGAQHTDANGDNSGSAYVVFGRADGFAATLSVASMTADQGFRIDGAGADAYAGSACAAAGDVNGDGFDDIMVAAPGAGAPELYGGASYVVFGHGGGFSDTTLTALAAGGGGVRLQGAPSGLDAGTSVAGIGDVNGDGVADMLVGGEHMDGGGGGGGAGGGFVVYGRDGGFGGASLDLTGLDGTDGYRMDGLHNGDRVGRSGAAAGAGDVNGDGFDDLVLGGWSVDGASPDYGAAYVVFGHPAGPGGTLSLAGLNGADGFVFAGVQALGDVGWSVSGAGDMDGDGFGDLVVGSDAADKAYVVLGHGGSFPAVLTPADLDGSNGFVLAGPAGGGAGYSIGAAGDVNGDGFDDIVLGAPHRGGLAGGAYVVFGRAGGFAAQIDLAALDGTDGFLLDPGADGTQVGQGVSSAGDLNGDGLDDLIIGAALATGDAALSGAAYVVYGRLPDTAVDRDGTAVAQSLVGGDLDDLLKGRGGDDRLWGHGGSDTIRAGEGYDVLIGGAGQDVLAGKGGSDRFVFQDVSDSPDWAHADRIKDIAADDIVDLTAIDADTTTPGNQPFHWVFAFSGHAGELLLPSLVGDSGVHGMVAGDVDGDGLADFALKLRGHIEVYGYGFAL